MRILYLLIFCFFVNLLFSQNGFSFEYKAESSLGDSAMHLIVLSQNGNSLNMITSDKDGKIFFRTLRLKKDSGFMYDYLGDGYKNTDSYQKTESSEFESYEVKVLGEEVINKLKCTKISLKVDNNLKEMLVWIDTESYPHKRYKDAYVFMINIGRLNTALEKINLKGFPVKIEVNGYPKQVYTFEKATSADVNKSFFKPKVTSQGSSSETLKKEKKISDEQYKQMKIEEEKIKKEFERKQK